MIDRFNPIYYKEHSFVAGYWCTFFDAFLFFGMVGRFV